jgi:chromosome segregation ATPase
MSSAARATLLTTILMSAALVASSREGRAQATTPPDVLQALLVEVRGLRQAMEQMASAGPRVQLALGRLQLQEQRVNTLSRRLEDIKTKITEANSGLEQASEQLTMFERMAKEAPDVEKRKEVEGMLEGFKLQMSRASAEIQRLQNEEVIVGQDISTEQARWSEINQRLEELERSLIRR